MVLPPSLLSDRTGDSRNGCVCLYFKENLPNKERFDIEILEETIVAEIKINSKENILRSVLLSPAITK